MAPGDINLSSYTLNPFPVYYGWASQEESNKQIALAPLPMELYLDDCGLLRQKVTSDLRCALDEIYRYDQNIGYLQEGHTLCDLYGGDFRKYIDTEIKRNFGASKIKILEIGSGGGYLAKYLAAKGHGVTTLDPSPLAGRTASDHGWAHISSTFPSEQCEFYDLVLNMDVWEHVYDPYEFALEVDKILRPGGVHISSIPDCGPSIRLGDSGIFMHQHISYFSEDSLLRCARKLQLKPSRLVRATVGGSLYVTLDKGVSPEGREVLGRAKLEDSTTTQTMQRFYRSRQIFLDFVSSELAAFRRVGIWNPLRAIPYLADSDLIKKLSFHDHDTDLHSRSPIGLDLVVDSRLTADSDGPDTIIIMSLSWHKQIISRLISDGIKARLVPLTYLLE